MKTRTRRRCLRELLLLGGAAVVPGCAAILHPERQGNDTGPIDVGALVLDILWFIPGLIPGIVALVIDFGTGAIFLCRSGARPTCRNPYGTIPATHDLAVRPGERLTVRAPAPYDDVEVRLRLTSPRGMVLDQAHGRWGPTRRDPLTIAFTSEHPHDRGDGRLELWVRRRGATATATHPLHLGLPKPA